MSKRISEEIKQKIIERIRNEGLSVPKASEKFGISRNAIYNWIGAKAKGEPSILEISKLRKENAELKQDNRRINAQYGAREKKSETLELCPENSISPNWPKNWVLAAPRCIMNQR